MAAADPGVLEAAVINKLKQEERIRNADLVGLDDAKNIIGAGAFGEVRRVMWRKTPVAAKIGRHDLTDHEKCVPLLPAPVRNDHPPSCGTIKSLSTLV